MVFAPATVRPLSSGHLSLPTPPPPLFPCLQVYVSDLREQCVNSPEMLLGLMQSGENFRHFGVINMNERSSRSHTIFRVIIEWRVRDAEEGEEEAVVVSHLNLVDLAGSERVGQTGATGHR